MRIWLGWNKAILKYRRFRPRQGRAKRGITVLRRGSFGVQSVRLRTTMLQHRLSEVVQTEHPKSPTFYFGLFAIHDTSLAGKPTKYSVKVK